MWIQNCLECLGDYGCEVSDILSIPDQFAPLPATLYLSSG